MKLKFNGILVLYYLVLVAQYLRKRRTVTGVVSDEHANTRRKCIIEGTLEHKLILMDKFLIKHLKPSVTF
jgi:hypothetical protein